MKHVGSTKTKFGQILPLYLTVPRGYTGVCFVLALCGFAWDSAIAKRRVKQCCRSFGESLGGAARLPV